MWYIFNSDKKLVATCSGKPDAKDLTSRDEFAVFSNEDIPFNEVELSDDNQVIHKTLPRPTPEEIVQAKLAALDSVYKSKFDAVTLAWAAATMEGDTETATACLADKEALKIEYQMKKEEIING